MGMRLVGNADGSGDLIFERTWEMGGDGDNKSTDHGFLAIPGVRAVENLIRHLTDEV
ncbi:hypothetical protein GCM10023212_06910 [Luteolibacter yonseiensis]